MGHDDTKDTKKNKKSYSCTLKQFLLLGQLGCIELGMPHNEILELLGKPRVSHQRSRYNKVYTWHYNCIELLINATNTKTLDGIRLYTVGDGIRLYPPLEGIGYFPSINASMEEFGVYLQQESIDYVWKSNDAKTKYYIYIEPNIRVRFDRYGKNNHLYSISCNYLWSLDPIGQAYVIIDFPPPIR